MIRLLNKYLIGLGVLASSFLAQNAQAQSLGELIKNTYENSTDTWMVVAAVSALLGILFGIQGIWKLKEHVENPGNVQIWEPMKRFLAGGMFLMLPFMRDVVIETLTGGENDAISGSNYNTGGASGNGLDAKLVNLMADIWDPFHFLILGFCYLAGIILLVVAISRIVKTEQEGPKGPTGIGTVLTFLTAGALFSVNPMLNFASQTIFESDVKANAALSYTAGMDGAAIGHANAVIGAIMVFVAILGWISFVRGFFIVRGVAEGNGQASMMAGLTHIFGGAVAVNLGAFIDAVQSTLGIGTYGLTISSIEPYITTVTMLA